MAIGHHRYFYISSGPPARNMVSERSGTAFGAVAIWWVHLNRAPEVHQKDALDFDVASNPHNALLTHEQSNMTNRRVFPGGALAAASAVTLACLSHGIVVTERDRVTRDLQAFIAI
jgi:hypothetical protein